MIASGARDVRANGAPPLVPPKSGVGTTSDPSVDGPSPVNGGLSGESGPGPGPVDAGGPDPPEPPCPPTAGPTETSVPPGSRTSPEPPGALFVVGVVLDTSTPPLA